VGPQVRRPGAGRCRGAPGGSGHAAGGAGGALGAADAVVGAAALRGRHCAGDRLQFGDGTWLTPRGNQTQGGRRGRGSAPWDHPVHEPSPGSPQAPATEVGMGGHGGTGAGGGRGTPGRRRGAGEPWLPRAGLFPRGSALRAVRVTATQRPGPW